MGKKCKKKSVIRPVGLITDFIVKSIKIRPLSTPFLAGKENPYEDKNKADKDDNGDVDHDFLLVYV